MSQLQDKNKEKLVGLKAEWLIEIEALKNELYELEEQIRRERMKSKQLTKYDAKVMRNWLNMIIDISYKSNSSECRKKFFKESRTCDNDVQQEVAALQAIQKDMADAEFQEKYTERRIKYTEC